LLPDNLTLCFDDLVRVPKEAGLSKAKVRRSFDLVDDALSLALAQGITAYDACICSLGPAIGSVVHYRDPKREQKLAATGFSVVWPRRLGSAGTHALIPQKSESIAAVRCHPYSLSIPSPHGARR
jgi:hypothetical protein